LIRPTVWPQHTNVTDRQTDRQDNRPIAYRANRFTNGRPKIGDVPLQLDRWAV